MNHTVKSLIFVVEHSVRAVENFTAKLDGLTPGDKRIPPLLKSLVTESDVLSSALVAASKHVEALPEDTCAERKFDPAKAKALLGISERFFAATENGLCEHCLGVLKSPEEQRIAPTR